MLASLLVHLGSGLTTPVGGATAANPWPMYAGDPQHTGRGAAKGPSMPPETQWSFSYDESLNTNTSPVLGPDGSVYLTAWTRFFALNPDGSLRCHRSLFASAAAPAVSADGSVVYVPDSNGLHALSTTTCAVLWDSAADTRISYSSPTIGPDGTIYFGTAATAPDRMIALNPNGSVKWIWNSGSECGIESSPALGPNGQVYFNQNCLGVVALDANGNHLWTRSGPGDAWNTVSVGPDGTLYIGDSDYNFYALNPLNGADKWKVGVQNWMYEASASISPDGSTIYRGDNGGIFYAFRSTGSIKWTFDTGIPGTISGAPAVGTDGVVYFSQGWTTAVGPNDRGYLYAVRGSDGHLLWKREIGWGNDSSVAIGPNGTIYAAA
ncbi:MAG TPA: PQQ-binding-like beta-propeller repeat protein, partial [Acidimicrobiales bacterium]